MGSPSATALRRRSDRHAWRLGSVKQGEWDCLVATAAAAPATATTAATGAREQVEARQQPGGGKPPCPVVNAATGQPCGRWGVRALAVHCDKDGCCRTGNTTGQGVQWTAAAGHLGPGSGVVAMPCCEYQQQQAAPAAAVARLSQHTTAYQQQLHVGAVAALPLLSQHAAMQAQQQLVAAHGSTWQRTHYSHPMVAPSLGPYSPRAIHHMHVIMWVGGWAERC